MTRPETSLSDHIGEQFGPYKLIRRLGVGGMAETFEAIRTGPGDFEQRVCLKLVLPFFQQNKDFLELFHREAKLAAMLRHSNIVGVIDFGEVDGKLYMALELVDGCDLRTLLDAQDRKRLSPEHVALIGLDLAAALEHAHSPASRKGPNDSGSIPRSIVHRDISPSNVLISRYGEVMLTDFGVAKAITGTARKQSAIKGKIPYMSPEQLSGDTIDGRSDLFALGVVLFEALCGQRPYEGPSDPATILLTLKGEHPSLKSLAPDAPAELCEIIESLLEPELGKRPQTAADLTELLDDFTASRRTRRMLGELVAATPNLAEPLAPEVASTVEETKRDRSASMAGEAETELGKKERPAPSPAPATAATGDPGRVGKAPKSRSKRRWPFLVVGLVTVVAGVVALGTQWPRGDNATAPLEVSAPEAVEPVAEPPSAEPPSVEPQDEEPVPLAEPEPKPESQPIEAAPVETKPRQRPSKATPVTAASARLTVIAIPWGNVWIDGRAAGTSPLKNKKMKPGRYEVSAGRESPLKSRTVRLRPGQRETVKFDLTE